MNAFPPQPPAGQAAQQQAADQAAQQAAAAQQQTKPPSPLAPPAGLPAGLASKPAGALGSVEAAPSDDRPPVDHGEPILTYGASGAAVERLAKLLAYAGYGHNTIVQGTNPDLVLDNSVMSDVKRFRADQDLTEPSDLFAGRDVAASAIEGEWVGPYTWQRLYEIAGAPAQG
jgi:hypothetical protein